MNINSFHILPPPCATQGRNRPMTCFCSRWSGVHFGSFLTSYVSCFSVQQLTQTDFFLHTHASGEVSILKIQNWVYIWNIWWPWLTEKLVDDPVGECIIKKFFWLLVSLPQSFITYGVLSRVFKASRTLYFVHCNLRETVLIDIDGFLW